MPIVDPLPTPYFRVSGASFDDEGTFAGAPSYTPNFATGNDVINSQTYPITSLDGIATAIEMCFYIDLSGPVDVRSFDVDGGPTVELETDANDIPTGIKIGSGNSLTLGKAWSLAALIRSQGIGTAYQPV